MYNLDIPGFMSESELKVIEQWASYAPLNGVIVEFGSFMGRSAYCWASSCHSSVTVYCVDMFPNSLEMTYENKNSGFVGMDIEQEFLKNTKSCKNIIPIKGKSPKGINFPDCKIDILFIDGSHTNPDDIQNFYFFKKFLNKNAFICGDDYHIEAVSTNAKFIANLYKKELKLYEGGTLWSVQI